MLELSPRKQLVWQLSGQPGGATEVFPHLETGPYCTVCQEALPLFVTDELAGEPVDHLYPALAYHLDICPRCLHEYESLAELTAAALLGEKEA